MVAWSRLLESAEHRPWRLPERSWAMTMSWCDLLFAHWQVPVGTLRELLPGCLEIDTYEGRAYLGVVPFRMEAVGPRGLGWLPGHLPSPRAFPELNVRTYVRVGDRPGVVFFSLDATSALAVWGARRFFHLPYFRAAITCHNEGDTVRYESRRNDSRTGPGDWRGRYRPTGEVYHAEPGTLEHWLTERYCLYAVDPRGRAHRGEVHHSPWPLQPAEAEIEINTVAEAHGLDLQGAPELLHFARRIDVVAWWPELCNPDGPRSAQQGKGAGSER